MRGGEKRMKRPGGKQDGTWTGHGGGEKQVEARQSRHRTKVQSLPLSQWQSSRQELKLGKKAD